jgi:hypothetical protein
LPSIAERISLSAVILSVKFIHMGNTNSISKTYFFLKLLLANIYAVGYASKRQTSVVVIASAKEYMSVPSVFVLAKKLIKFANENLPSPFVNA